MKSRMVSFTIMILLVGSFAALALAATKGAHVQGNIGPYNPAVTYPGDYGADGLLVKNVGSQMWFSIPQLGRIQNVTCPDAVDHLTSEGTWKGHLNLDGSCGTFDEPAQWATGNWMNYNDAVEEQNAQ